MRNAIVAALLAGIACTQLSAASAVQPAHALVILADWQSPDWLPPRFRNHCAAEYFTGRQYCADHCGSAYQFFYCSEMSFGCCHLGRGYCDFHGILRCSP